MCQYEMQGPGLPPLHSAGSLSSSSTVPGSSSGQTPESPGVGSPHMHPHLTSGKNLEVVWSKSHLVMRMIEMRIGQEPLLQVRSPFQYKSENIIVQFQKISMSTQKRVIGNSTGEGVYFLPI